MTKKKILTITFILLIIICIPLFLYLKNITSPKDNLNINTEVSIDTIDKSDTSDTSDTLSNTDSSKDTNRFDQLTLTNEDIGIPVIYYHSVLPDSEVTNRNEVTISPELLKEELQLIKDLGYTTLTISEVYDYILNSKPIPEKSILITFDDGYTDNYVYAYPILKELEMKATIFLISSGIDSGYYLGKDQIKEMNDYGIDFQSHTVNHVYLDSLSYEEQLKELTESKKQIEDLLGKEIVSIAYPYGNYNEDTVRAAKTAGYSLAFTTNLGLSDRDDNPLTLDRIYVSSTYSLETFKNRLLNTEK